MSRSRALKAAALFAGALLGAGAVTLMNASTRRTEPDTSALSDVFLHYGTAKPLVPDCAATVTVGPLSAVAFSSSEFVTTLADDGVLRFRERGPHAPLTELAKAGADIYVETELGGATLRRRSGGSFVSRPRDPDAPAHSDARALRRMLNGPDWIVSFDGESWTDSYGYDVIGGMRQ